MAAGEKPVLYQAALSCVVWTCREAPCLCKNSNQAVLYNIQRLWPPSLLNRLDKGFGFILIICTMHHFKRGCEVQRGALQSLHGAVKTRRLI